MRTLASIALVAALGTTASAQMSGQEPQGMPGMSIQGTMREMMRSMESANTPAAKAYAQAMDKMHKDMAIEFSDNAGADFARAMIPHHQGALDMAQVALQYAKDDEIRRIAQKTIDDQTKDIKELRSWLERHQSAATGSSPGK